MLGLHHINEAAAMKNPGSNPYGDTMEQQLNIMGMGDIVTRQNYLPFKTAMTAFTGCPMDHGQGVGMSAPAPG